MCAFMRNNSLFQFPTVLFVGEATMCGRLCYEVGGATSRHLWDWNIVPLPSAVRHEFIATKQCYDTTKN